ncbi:MAG: glutathione-disulfide reductase [Alphaproteobacteria bacterium]
MPKYDYDLFTIGGGSGGVRACRVAAGHGARVAVAEDRYLGGTCVNVGCIPKKLLVYAAHFGEDFEDAAAFGWKVGARTFGWQRLIANKNREIERLNGVYERLLTDSGVDIIAERAHLADAHTVVVNGKRYTAEHILIATGSWPVVPGIRGREHAITSNEAFFLESLPGRVIIVGGGYIAVEFAGIFTGMGVEVTQTYRGPHFLRGFDDDLRTVLAEEMKKKGVNILFNTNIVRIEKRGKELLAELEDGTELVADTVMYATGRKPTTAGLGLEEAGVKLAQDGAVVVDAWSRSSVDNIFAVGDVTNRINLTPVALAEGRAAADTMFGDEPRKPDHTGVPSAVFSQPNIGKVGLTEAQARERHGAVDAYVSTFTPLKHTLTGRDEKTFMKLIVDSASDRVVGIHMVGPEAGEIIQGFAVAMKAGATKAQFDATIGIHPTAAEEFVSLREKVPEPAAEAAE